MPVDDGDRATGGPGDGDHAWPGWRDLPLVPRPPESGTNAKQKQAMAQRIKQVNGRYPTGWLESSGPIRTRRQRYGTRHVPTTPRSVATTCVVRSSWSSHRYPHRRGDRQVPGLTVLHVDQDFDMTAAVTDQPVERLTNGMKLLLPPATVARPRVVGPGDQFAGAVSSQTCRPAARSLNGTRIRSSPMTSTGRNYLLRR